jgi:hypothetical protein
MSRRPAEDLSQLVNDTPESVNLNAVKVNAVRKSIKVNGVKVNFGKVNNGRICAPDRERAPENDRAHDIERNRARYGRASQNAPAHDIARQKMIQRTVGNGIAHGIGPNMTTPATGGAEVAGVVRREEIVA